MSRKSKASKAEDTMSTFSKISVFSSVDDAQKKKLKEGYLGLSLPSADGKNKGDFVNMFVELTNDCRINVSKGAVKNRYVILECNMLDPIVFRLSAKSETDLSQGNTAGEILVKAESESEGIEWLIAIEKAVRSRLETYRNELDCARGFLEIKEIAPNAQTLSTKGMKPCQCFYYQNAFRVKGLDGPMTSSFTIQNVRNIDIDFPLCFIIDTSGRSFMLRTDDVEQFNKWTFSIDKDLERVRVALNRKQQMTMKQVYEGDLLMGPAPDKLVRLSVRYLPEDHLLESRDYNGQVNSFYLERLIALPKSRKARTYNLVFIVSVSEVVLDTAEGLKLYVSGSECDTTRLRQLADSNVYTLVTIVECLVVEIELRRMVHSENTGDKRKRAVTMQDVYYLMTLEKPALGEVLRNKAEWPVGRLERTIQVLLKVPTEPIVTFDLQPQFLNLGREMHGVRVPKESHYREVTRLMQKLSNNSREIVERLTVHIYRLTQFYHAAQPATPAASAAPPAKSPDKKSVKVDKKSSKTEGTEDGAAPPAEKKEKKEKKSKKDKGAADAADGAADAAAPPADGAADASAPPADGAADAAAADGAPAADKPEGKKKKKKDKAAAGAPEKAAAPAAEAAPAEAAANQSNSEKKRKSRKASGVQSMKMNCTPFSAPEVMIWSRLCKYIFRYNEQEIDTELAESYLPSLAVVMLAYQHIYVETTRQQVTQCSSETKKNEMNDACKQQ